MFPTWLQTGIARSLPQRRLCMQGMGMVSTRCTIRNYVHPCANLQWKLVAFPHLRSLFGVDVLFNHWGTKSDYFQWLLLLKLLSLFDNAPAVSSLCDHVPDMPPICPSAGYTDQNKLALTPTSRFGP